MKKFFALASSVVFITTILTACASNIPTSIPPINTDNVTANVSVTLSATPSATSTPFPIETPTLALSAIGGWDKFVDPKYGFSFQYPPFSQTCCGLPGPITGESELIITLVDESSIVPNTDRPFDGLAIYVVQNGENLTLQEYVENEKTALIQEGKTIMGDSFVSSGSDSTVIIDRQTEVVIQGYSWSLDTVQRIYIPFPDRNLFLFIAIWEKSEGSFEQTLRQIISSFRFAD